MAWAAFLTLLAGSWANADLRSPSWFDTNAVGSAPDWHYRVPIPLPAGVFRRSTIRVDADFNALLAQLGVSGVFDANSVRVVRENGSLCALQQFSDRVYAGSDDPMGNARGEIRFILQDDGPGTYYLYFDILANGAKPAWDVGETINGSFEFSQDGEQDPPGWNGRDWSAYDAYAIFNEYNRTVTTDAGSPSWVVTDEIARTGAYCYLLGARNADEARDRDPSTRLERTIDVPAGNPGLLQLHYRIKGWDGSDDGANQWDFIQIQLRRGGQVVADLVGPDAASYAIQPFSANQGIGQAGPGQSGYGQYNGWDTDTNGNHHSGMALAPGSEPWFTVSADLSPFANQSLTLRIETRNSTAYKSWFHIDDVEWSVVNVALDPMQAQAYGINITAPNDTASGPATVYNAGDTLVIRVQVDALPAAAPDAVTAELIDPTTAVMAGNIVLYNDGAHGDGAAGDAIWGNNNAYTFSTTNFPGTTWKVVVYGRDGSSSNLGATDGLVHIPGQPDSPLRQANYFNVDDQQFTLITPPNLVLTKTVSSESDPINGSSNPKAIPGATLLYVITANNSGGTGTDSDSVLVTDPIPDNAEFYVGDLCADLGLPGSGPVVFEDGSTASGLTYTFSGLGGAADDIAFSSTGGPPFVYVPAPDADGYDASVRAIQVNPKGIFNGISGLNRPEFRLRFRIRVQ